MKNFSVTYRGKDGKQQVVLIAAEDRKGVFDELAKRGISAIRIEETNGKVKPRKTGSGEQGAGNGMRPSVVKGLVAGVIVVAAAFAALWFLARDKPAAPEEAKPKKPAKIAETKPAPVATPRSQTTNGVSSVAEREPEEKKPLTVHDRLAKRKFGENNRVVTNKVQRVKSRYEIFNHRSENHLALLATIPMGASLVGTRRFDERFMKDLEVALSEKVEIKPDDSEYDRNLKIAVEDLKEELRRRKADGEDLAQVLDDTFKEIQKLGVYRHEIEKMVSRTMREDATLTDGDVDDLVGAANKMLEEKGIAPIRVDKTLRSVIRSKARLNEGEKEK